MMLSMKIIFFLISLGVLILGELYENVGESDVLTRLKKAVVQKKFKFKLPIRYYMDPFVNHTSIQLAIKKIESYTCITFKPHWWYIEGTSGFNFKSSYTCHSPFGPKVGDEKHENYILLSKIGTMLYLVFEYNRHDRDQYVKINDYNIDPTHKKDFEKYNYSTVETYGLQYDFYSGLHIFPTNFSIRGRAVLERKTNFSIRGLEFGLETYGLQYDFYSGLHIFPTNFSIRGRAVLETYGLQYDFYSGLHIFPTNLAVLERKNNFSIPGLEFGQAVGLSFNDHKLLFNRYCLWNSSLDLSSRKQCENQGYHDLRRWGKNKCICPNGFDGDHCEKPIKNLSSRKQCENQGYHDLRRWGSNKCICPNGFEGDHCEKPIMDTKACDCKGDNKRNATTIEQTITLKGKGRCSYFIKSQKKFSIVKIYIKESRTPYSYPCYPNKGHEIKYMWDKGTTGLTLCGGYVNIPIVSESNFTVIIYNGIDDDSKLVFKYSQQDFVTTTVPPSRTTTTRSIVTTTPLPSTPSLPPLIPPTPSPTTTQSTTTTSTTTQSTTTTPTTTQSTTTTSTTTKRKTTKKKKPKPKPKPKPNCTKKPKKKKWKHKIVIKID
uniref:Metalloendopeptidase n=1 Tax=Strongyloides papillosus TaxID=174720 RepID=A0A0N5BL88_STREA